MITCMQTHQPRTPRQDRSIATKRQLFQSALELFAEEGYPHTTTKKIAARAGIAVGSFYAYYTNKKAVFLEVIRYYYGRITDEVFGDFPEVGLPAESGRASGIEGAAAAEGNRAAGQGSRAAGRGGEAAARENRAAELSPRDYLAVLLRRLYEAHDISPQLHREITGMRYTDPDVDRLLHEEEHKTIVRVQGVLESLQPVLEVTDTEAAAHVVHRSAEELIHSIKIFGAPVEPERLLSELERMLSRYLFGVAHPDS